MLAFRDFAANSSRSFGGNERTGITGVGVSREPRELPSFSRVDTHVLSRSPGSRDERALRAPLKATPDSKPRLSPATLAPGPPPSPPLSRCPLPLGISLSHAGDSPPYSVLLLLSFSPLSSSFRFSFSPFRLRHLTSLFLFLVEFCFISVRLYLLLSVLLFAYRLFLLLLFFLFQPLLHLRSVSSSDSELLSS